MNETIMVLFVLFIILGLGIVVYYKFAHAGLKSLSFEISEEESSILLVSVASMPEIGCEGGRDFCLDTSKLSLFKFFSKNNQEFYRKKWGYRKIWVEQVYPKIERNVECTAILYNSLDYPDNCKYWGLYENKPSKIKGSYKVSSIYPLYFPETGKYRVGMLNIEVYG